MKSKKVPVAKMYDEWTEVKELWPISIIGSAQRFSISIPLDDEFRVGINGCRVVEGKKGKFISFPAWRDEDGEYHDIAFVYLGKQQQHIIDMF